VNHVVDVVESFFTFLAGFGVPELEVSLLRENVCQTMEKARVLLGFLVNFFFCLMIIS